MSMAVEQRPAVAGRPPLEIHRSQRRRRGASARPRDGVVVVRLPAGLPAAEEERLIDRLVGKVTGQARADALGGDEGLRARAEELADRYLDGVRATSVTWSGRMSRRLGSCTPAHGTIRVAREVAAFPAWVRDYVLLHELAHLVVADHSGAFHELVGRYPHAERARGWVEGFTAGRLAAAAGPVMPTDDPATADPATADPTTADPATADPTTADPAVDDTAGGDPATGEVAMGAPGSGQPWPGSSSPSPGSSSCRSSPPSA
jgi:predicted metal-dependent hydrolase